MNKQKKAIKPLFLIFKSTNFKIKRKNIFFLYLKIKFKFTTNYIYKKISFFFLFQIK